MLFVAAMRRDLAAFTLAGVVFGFCAGYMAANWGALPRPAAAATGRGSTAAPTAGAAPQPAEASALDPDEVRALESLAARQTGDKAVRVQLGNLYMDHRRWEDAIRWYRDALAIAPDDPDVVSDLGACLVQVGQPEAGLAEFERVLLASPAHRNALFNKGLALLKLGRPQETVAVWEELLRRHPGDPQLERLRGRLEELRAAPAATVGAARPAR